MTREILNEIVKSKKINLDHYDKVKAFINKNYTYIHVIFGLHECAPGGHTSLCDCTHFRLSIANILKKEQHTPEDYETSPCGDFIWSIK